jgi:ABC-type multidrug transport system permease subunit
MSAGMSAWAICRKDLLLWLRRPLMIAVSLAIPVSYTLVVFLGAAATSREPAAVVNLDHGPAGAALTRAIIRSGVFQVYVTSPAKARQMYDGMLAAAVITIPADMSRLVAEHRQAPVSVLDDNMNMDLEGDVHRAVPDAIVTYYASQGTRSPMRVTVAEHLLRGTDIQLYQYSVLPVIILIVTVTGLMTSGMSAATEFEQHTVKELLGAPIARGAIITGKMAAGWVFTTGLAAAMLAAGDVTGFIHLHGRYWLTALTAITLSAAFAAGAGVAIGTWAQRKQPVTVAATIAAVQLFALSGGVGVIWFEPGWLQRIAAGDPLTYGIHALQEAVFYNSSAGFARDTAVLAVTAVLAATAGTLAMRREVRA